MDADAKAPGWVTLSWSDAGDMQIGCVSDPNSTARTHRAEGGSMCLLSMDPLQGVDSSDDTGETSTSPDSRYRSRSVTYR